MHRSSTKNNFTFFLTIVRPPPPSTLFPYPTLFRSARAFARCSRLGGAGAGATHRHGGRKHNQQGGGARSEEHTSELQSHSDLVCRLLLEKKKVLLSERPLKQNQNSPEYTVHSYIDT